MQNTKNLLVMDKTVVAVRRKIMLCYRKKKKQLQIMDTAHANVAAVTNN